MLEWSASKWMLILGIAGSVYAVFLLIFRRGWPDRRKDKRRWQAERRDGSSETVEETDEDRREESDRRQQNDRREL